MTFSQKKTDLLLLLKTAKQQLDEMRTPTSEQMLIVISDGRGALSQGADKVRALYSALQGVTVLFIVLDSGKKSIEDHTVASFKDNKVVSFSINTKYNVCFSLPLFFSSSTDRIDQGRKDEYSNDDTHIDKSSQGFEMRNQ